MEVVVVLKKSDLTYFYECTVQVNAPVVLNSMPNPQRPFTKYTRLRVAPAIAHTPWQPLHNKFAASA